MSWIDLVILGVILLSSLISLVRGFVKESISLATWLLAGFIALSYHQVLAEMLAAYIESPSISLVVAFGILFLATLIVGAIINFMVSQLVSKTGLSGTDKTLGVIFGAARGVLIIAMVVLFADLTPIPSEPWWQESILIEQFSGIADWIRSLLPEEVVGQTR